MKLYIAENERGFLFKDGVFQRLLEPGKHNIHAFLGQSVYKDKIGDTVNTKGLDYEVFARDPAFVASTTRMEVPDGHIALHFVDGRLAGALTAGEYLYWSLHKTRTFQLLDIREPEVQEVPAAYFALIPRNLYTRIDVSQGSCALLYFDGVYQRKLDSGAHFFWNGGVKVTAQVVDLRDTQLEITGQEILTADKVSLRLNFVCTYRITDPVGLTSALQDYLGRIYSTVQLALRQYVGRFRFDELLEQKESIAADVLAQLKQQEEKLYVEFVDAGLKDVILPGEIREIMNTVLVAEKTAQANVIARREEVASTRSLLNTARLMEENSTLFKLKELEYLERICDKVGSISVSGGGNLLAQLRELMSQ